jgi:putative ubiquitin-RnfH superfamily antitoxin RatB of RatAB toxin-antitoxin module
MSSSMRLSAVRNQFMADVADIQIEVAYATQDSQRIVALRVPPDTLVREALRLSGIAAEFPEIDIVKCPVGIFGRQVNDEYRVAAGDRVEIYRPLERDPREARRELAARGLTM